MEVKLLSPVSIVIALDLDELGYMLQQIEWYHENRIPSLCLDLLSVYQARLEEFECKYKPSELDTDDKARLARYKRRWTVISSRQAVSPASDDLITVNLSNPGIPPKKPRQPKRLCDSLCSWFARKTK